MPQIQWNFLFHPFCRSVEMHLKKAERRLAVSPMMQLLWKCCQSEKVLTILQNLPISWIVRRSCFRKYLNGQFRTSKFLCWRDNALWWEYALRAYGQWNQLLAIRADWCVHRLFLYIKFDKSSWKTDFYNKCFPLHFQCADVQRTCCENGVT